MVRYWLDAGHDVTVLNTWSERTVRHLDAIGNGVRTVFGSVTDPEIVGKTVRGHDVVVALAARINVDESIRSPAAVTAVNVLGTQNVLEAAVSHGIRVIYASSCEVYGAAGPLPATEESCLRPKSPYAATKAGADRLCFAYFETYGLDVTVVRPCNVYGERQKDGGGGAVIGVFVSNALRGLPLTVFGSGEQRREYMHVSDVVAAYDLVLNRPDLAGETLNCGTGETVSVREIAESIAGRLDAEIEYGPPRPGEVDAFLLDSTKIRRLGFAPKMAFQEGLERYVRWRVAYERRQMAAGAVPV